MGLHRQLWKMTIRGELGDVLHRVVYAMSYVAGMQDTKTSKEAWGKLKKINLLPPSTIICKFEPRQD